MNSNCHCKKDDINKCTQFKCHNMCCCFEHLKPLEIDSLFMDNCDQCSTYEDSLNKSKAVRSAFFSAKAAIVNFVTDCSTLEEKLQADISDNELDSIKLEYLSLVNDMTASMYTGLRKVYEKNLIINVDNVQSADISLHNNMRSGDIIFKNPDLVPSNLKSSMGRSVTVLAHIPGVTIHLNIDTKEVKIRFCEPIYNSTHSRSFKVRSKSKDVCNEYRITGGITNYSNIDNILDNDDIFSSVNNAREFLEDIINYSDENNISNDLVNVIAYLDKVISSSEHAHRFVVQLSKIQDAQNNC